MSTTSTIYVVSGATRGIGLGLVTTLLTLKNTIVIAGARDIKQAENLDALVQSHPDSLYVVPLSSESTSDAVEAAKFAETKYGRVDVIIANAGVVTHFGPVSSTPLESFESHFNINTLGPIRLYQAFHDLLLKSSSPQYLLISTAGASLGTPVPFLVGAYGASKAAANFLTTKIHQEEPTLTISAIHPGIGNAGAIALGLEKAPQTIDESVTGILKHITEATREKSGGKFWDYTGVELVW
ncbi:NAD(P)-binding protein [Meredithblackwellia eburnea MCA 4105]